MIYHVIKKVEEEKTRVPKICGCWEHEHWWRGWGVRTEVEAPQHNNSVTVHQSVRQIFFSHMLWFHPPKLYEANGCARALSHRVEGFLFVFLARLRWTTAGPWGPLTMIAYPRKWASSPTLEPNIIDTALIFLKFLLNRYLINIVKIININIAHAFMIWII